MTTGTAIAIQTLRLFNEKAAKLERSEFAAKIFDEPSGVNIAFDVGSGVKAQQVGPSEGAIDASVLTLRLFMQKREPISLESMVKLYTDLPVNPAIGQKFNEVKAALDEFLSSPISRHSVVKVEIDGQEPTRQDLITYFIYGDLAHVMDAPKRKVLETWRANPIIHLALENHLNVTMSAYLNTIFWMRELNDLALKELEGAS
jgi:hypothetical protein